MSIKKWMIAVVAGAMAVTAVVSAISYSSVSAAAPTTTISQRGGGPGMLGGTTDQSLADALGIDLTTLQTAQKAANAEALKQAVAAGLITQAQADQMTTDGRYGDNRWLSANGIDYNALLASQLGITVDELNAASQKAYLARIDSAVAAGNMTQDQADMDKAQYALQNSTDFQNAIKAAYQAALNQAVQSGLITQNQADLLLQNNTNTGLEGIPGLGGHGGFGGHGRDNGGIPGVSGQPAPNQATPDSTPSNGL